MPALGDEIGAEERAAQLEDTCKSLQRRLAKAEAKSADLIAAVYEAARDAAVVAGTPSAVPPPRRDRRKAGEEVALLHLTDVHVGAVTASTNVEVTTRRVMEAVGKAVRISDVQRADHPVRECVLLLGGDLIEQTAQFAHQVWHVEQTTFDQVFTAARILGDAILSLLGGFERVTVYEVPGNHGRVGRGKGRQSLDYETETNWDRIVGRVIRDNLAGQDRLTWHDADTWYHVGEIGAYRFLVHHGDTIRGFGGNIPAYGILRKHMSWAAGVMPEFTDAYLGHFHIPMSIPLPAGGRVFVTPSCVSGSSFAKEWMAAESLPGQRLHMIDPERGRVTAEYLLWLD